MNIQPRLSRLLPPLLVGLVLAIPASAKKISAIAVAERPRLADHAISTENTPIVFAPIDGGYIEAGDPIAGETPPAAIAVSDALQSTLVASGHAIAASSEKPDIALVYHWGLIRKDRQAIRIPFQLDPNLRSRLSLVTSHRDLRELERHIVSRRDYPATPANFIEHPSHRTSLDLARDPRYFVVLTAYDYAALTRRETRLLWRVKLSADDNDASMAATIPALMREATRYFGRDLRQREFTSVTIAATSPSSSSASSSRHLPSPDLDDAFLRELLRLERAEFSGRPLPKSPSHTSTL